MRIWLESLSTRAWSLVSNAFPFPWSQPLSSRLFPPSNLQPFQASTHIAPTANPTPPFPQHTDMLSGPICAMVWEGRDAVKTGRTLLGATNPLASAPGTIRGDYAIDVGRNVCHGSDAVESAQKEIALWFKPEEVLKWKKADQEWVYEKP